ncbi:MAG TPA: hypothetical protein VG734_22320 [Lacunisphaera sp.]|nr:hypothetical protein [Lacunisphaera sp.]
MNPSNETRLRKIERASTLIRTAISALYVPVAIITVASTVAVVAGWSAHISYEGQVFIPSALPLSSRLILALAVLAAGAVAAKGLFHLRRLAGNYTRREIFTTDSARQIRDFGVSCMLWGVVKVVWAFLPLLVSVHRMSVYSTSIDPILMGAVIVGISWFAEMAAALREENELTI